MARTKFQYYRDIAIIVLIIVAIDVAANYISGFEEMGLWFLIKFGVFCITGLYSLYKLFTDTFRLLYVFWILYAIFFCYGYFAGDEIPIKIAKISSDVLLIPAFIMSPFVVKSDDDKE